MRNYPTFSPPGNFPGYRNLTPGDAKKHLEWFVSQENKRLELLMQFYKSRSIFSSDSLDFSEGSLVPLWGWARKKGAVFINEEKRNSILATAPSWVKKVDLDLRELTFETACFCVDIGFYFLTVFREKYPNRKFPWIIGSHENKNEPVVSGFKLEFIPKDLISGAFMAYSNGRKSKDFLLEKFKVWEEYLA